VKQLRDYIDEIRSDECIGGILIAKHFTKKVLDEAKNNGIACCVHSFENVDESSEYSFEKLLSKLKLVLNRSRFIVIGLRGSLERVEKAKIAL